MDIRKGVIEAAACNPRETTMSSHHDCEGLATCREHPRWIVHRNFNHKWVTVPPHTTGHDSESHTYAEAINHAQKEATK